MQSHGLTVNPDKMPLFQTSADFATGAQKALTLLEAHREAFVIAEPLANETGHTVPSDTKSWSQILVSVLTGLSGRARLKGSDLDDGSDVKAACVWGAVDTPRFNGCLPCGRTTVAAKKADDVSALDDEPFLFFVLWDTKPTVMQKRCRVWVVRPPVDTEFRKLASKWYALRAKGVITSTNCQLHPPRNLDTNVIRNTCGNLEYPLFFSAVYDSATKKWVQETLNPSVLESGSCKPSL